MPDDELVRNYLLGRLPAAERERIEQRYFADDAFFAQVEACEEELIRDYAARALPEDDRRAFAAKFLRTPDKRVAFAAALRTAAQSGAPGGPAGAPTPAAHSFGAIWASALAAALLVTAGSAVLLDLRMGRIEARLNQAAPAAPLAPPPKTASFNLFPETQRGARAEAGSAGSAALLIPPVATDVLLQLSLEPGQRAARYRAALSASGGEVWSSQASPGAAGDAVEIRLPAWVLSAGSYILTLDAAPSGAAHESYEFQVARQ